ncbi:ribosomal RNA-processing protein 8-like [Lineus longissimus]|uniref:ribosomal RNA-processing protein 8-like n=1 Tax=Lineus longissimus TaxID=88925 RepID=UPI002B4DC0BC
MFAEESQWNVERSADTLNQSLFGEVPILTSTKKKTQKKIDQVLIVSVKSNLTPDKKKKARLRNKYPPTQTNAIKENHDLSVESEIKKNNDLVTSTAFNKKKKAVKVELSGNSLIPKKRKKNKANNTSELSQSTKILSEENVRVTKAVESAGTPLSCEEGQSPDKKRKKNRKRKPNNKYAHLVQKRDPVESALGKSEKQSNLQRKQVDVVSAVSSLEIATKISRKGKKHKLQNGGEHSEGKSVLGDVSSDIGLTKMKHKNKKVVVNQNGSGSSMEISLEVPKEAVVESRSAKKRNKKKKLLNEMKGSSDSSGGLVTDKSKQGMAVGESDGLTNTNLESGSGKKKRNRKRRHQIDDESVDVESKKPKISCSNVDTSPKETLKKSFGASSPFDVSELRKRLSISGDSPGGKILKKMDKDVAKGAHKAEVKKVPQTLRERMMEKLNSARFRSINEQLYTCSGKEAYSLFEEDPSTFKVYHEGFQNQVEKWPVNPVDKMIEYIQSKSNANLIVADFGCGDARIAQSVSNKVHSFDLVAVNEHITACDMSKVPLRSNCVDIGIFCLSLMGTNLVDYLHEASRIMKIGGVLLIAEVVSRIKRVNIFIHQVEDLGFMLMHQDKSNKMFILFEFKKARNAPPKHRLEPIELLPCVYKKR